MQSCLQMSPWTRFGLIRVKNCGGAHNGPSTTQQLISTNKAVKYSEPLDRKLLRDQTRAFCNESHRQ